MRKKIDPRKIKRFKLPENSRLSALKLLLSPALGGLTAYVLSALGGKFAALLGVMITYVFVAPVGKAIILTAPAIGFGGFTVMLALLWIDALIISWLIWNFDHSKKLPWIGKKIAAAERKTKAAFLKRPRLRKLSYLGIALFIALPGPGIVVGTVLGRLLSLSPWGLFGAAMLGSILSSLIIFPAYFGISFLNNYFPLPFAGNVTGAFFGF